VEIARKLTITDASTILSPWTPFTFKSGSTTPSVDLSLALIAAVPIEWYPGPPVPLMNASSKISRGVASGSGVKRAVIYSDHAGALKNRMARDMPIRRASTSKGCVNKPRSMTGGSNGFDERSVTLPPTVHEHRSQWPGTIEKVRNS
jgi:hypothetical protein